MVAVLQGGQFGEVFLVPFRGEFSQPDQGVGTFADGGAHQDGTVAFHRFADNIDQFFGRGDRGASEFHYLHRRGSIMAVRAAVSSRKPSWPKREGIW